MTILNETADRRATETVYAQFSRMGWNFWIISGAGKRMIDRSTAERMIGQGAKRVVI
jgi:hypothetical protein